MKTCIKEEIITDMYQQNFAFCIDSMEFIEQYLQEKRKTGQYNMKTIRTGLFDLFYFVKTTALRDFTKKMLFEYFQNLNTRMIKTRNSSKQLAYATKLTYYRILHAFFRSYEEFVDDEQYKNPFPSKSRFKFTPPKILSYEEIEKKRENSTFTIEEIKYVLQKAYNVSLSGSRMIQRLIFPELILLIFCGMRNSEVCTIKKANLNIEKRFLSTGTEENAKKSKKLLVFPFPEGIQDILREYVLELENLYPDTEWLFPNAIGDKHGNVRRISNFLASISQKKRFKTHMFRKTLSTFRMNDPNHRCPDTIEETLTGHAITSVLRKNYDQYSLEMRRRDYDDYFPTEYKQILEFLAELV